MPSPAPVKLIYCFLIIVPLNFKISNYEKLPGPKTIIEFYKYHLSQVAQGNSCAEKRVIL